MSSFFAGFGVFLMVFCGILAALANHQPDGKIVRGFSLLIAIVGLAMFCGAIVGKFF